MLKCLQIIDLWLELLSFFQRAILHKIIICNLGTHDLLDMYGLSSRPVATGLRHTYQASHLCPCYNYYVHVATGLRHTYQVSHLCPCYNYYVHVATVFVINKQICLFALINTIFTLCIYIYVCMYIYVYVYR